MFLSAPQAVGDGVEQSRGAHALALVVNDNGGGVLALPIVAELDLAVAQVDGGFVASAGEAEGVVFLDLSRRLGVEEFIMVLRRRQEADTRQVDAEAVDRPTMPRASWGMAL